MLSQIQLTPGFGITKTSGEEVECMNEWKNEWMNELISEWVSD